jgi:CubicO group peptidase (beta-lactamase class C family)
MNERPTLATWLQPGNVFWSFRHTRELVPTERVRRGPEVRPLNPAPRPDLLDVEVDTHIGRLRVSEVLGHDRDALVVLHGDDLLVDWMADGVRSDEPHLIFSVTKSVTGLLAGALAGAGKLDLSASPLDYLPEIAGSGFADATLRQVLDMEASYAFVEDYSPGPDVVAYRHAAGWYPAPADAPALQGFLASRAPDGEHGRSFRYLSPTTDLMGWICARAAGTTWAEAVSTYLWEPIGAEHDAEVTVDREGTPRAAGGMSALPRDLARLGLVVAERGAGIVSEEFLDDLLHAGHREQWARGDFADMWPDGAYRSGWYTPHLDPDVALGVGIYGQMLYVDVPRQVVVVMLSSWSRPDDDDWHDDNHTICRTLAHRVAG